MSDIGAPHGVGALPPTGNPGSASEMYVKIKELGPVAGHVPETLIKETPLYIVLNIFAGVSGMVIRI